MYFVYLNKQVIVIGFILLLLYYYLLFNFIVY